MIILVNDFKVDFELTKIDSENYKIYASDIKLKSKTIFIYFGVNITSKYNSLLITTQIEHELNPNQENINQIEGFKKAEATKKLGQTGSTAGASISVVISILNLNISSLFNFLTTAEMFYTVYLFNINLSPILSEFLLSTRLRNSIPNIAKYFISPDNNSNISKKFGYKSHLTLINIRVQLSTLLFLLILYLASKILIIIP